MDGTKQLDLHVRYWSHITHEVVLKFLKANPLGHATENNTLFFKITKALQNEGVPVSKLCSLASDGPNDNKQCLDSCVKSCLACGRPLVDKDTFTLHIVHNGFGADVKAYGSQTQELAFDLHAFLRVQLPGRRICSQCSKYSMLNNMYFMICTNKMGNTGQSLAKNHTTNAFNCRIMERICKTGFKEPITKCSIQENYINIAEETFTLVFTLNS